MTVLLQPGYILVGKLEKGKSFLSHKYLRDVHFNRAPLSGRVGSIHHHPDAFISEELTTYFPADGCKVHVLVYDSDEDIRQDIQEGARIVGQPSTAKTMAHNLYGIAYHFYRNKLDPELIEMVKKGDWEWGQC